MTVVKIDRNNTLDVLRLVSAIFVILHHSYPLTGNPSLFSTLGSIAVSTFFIISGYVIAQSWFSDPTPSRFFWKRVLRLVPGLAGVVIFTIFVIGPINTSLSLQEYYFNIHTWIYSGVILIFSPYQTLPGVFMSNPYPTAVNASLWTIPIEFGLYILLCIMGVIGMLKDRRVLLSVVVLSCAIYINGIWTCVWPVLSDALRHIGTPDALGHMGISKYLLYLRNAVIPANSHIYNLLFFIGSLFFIYKDQIKFSNRLALGAFIGLLILIDSATSYQDIAVLICLPYLVLYIGQLPIRQLYNIGDKYGDYSYGLYIYAFPVQQTIAHFIPKISPIQMFALSLPSTFIFAYISWWLIEKKALSLKKMDPKKIFLDKFRYVTTLL